MRRQYLKTNPLGLADIVQFAVGPIPSVILVLLSMRT